MKRKSMLQLCALAFAVCATVVLVACSGASVSAGYKSQSALAKAYFNHQKKAQLSSYGEYNTKWNALKFDYDSKFMGKLSTEAMQQECANEQKERKEIHKAKMNGSWVVDYNDNGTVKSRFKDEANKTAWDTYKNNFNRINNQVKSRKITGTEKHVEKTKEAVAYGYGGGLATVVEVWEVTYEYQAYKVDNGAVVVDGDKQTGLKDYIRVYKVGSKWYISY